MTIIVTLGNSRQVIQISDRRLSASTGVLTDSSNKCLSFICLDARVAVGFTGLAQIGAFRMQHWLVDAFAEAAKPDCLFFNTMERLKGMLTELFQNDRSIRIQRSEFKRLSIMASGYHLGSDGTKAVGVLVSNFESTNRAPAANAADDFQLSFIRQNSHVDICHMVTAIGNTNAFSDRDWLELSQIVRSNALVQDVLEIGKTVIRRAAARKEAARAIGKHLAAIVVPANGDEIPYAKTFNNKSSDTVLAVDLVFSTPTLAYVIRDPTIKLPMQLAPDTGLRDPCYCGSGQRFKNCHGRKRRT